MSSFNRRKQGEVGEDLAVDYLKKAGFKILERNYRYERNEIDIIAEDGEDLVFVEVKARHSAKFGEPEDAITEEKQMRIQKAADGYFYEREIDNHACRFDVIAIEYCNDKPEIRHIRDAF